MENTGKENSGDWNNGNWNSGDWNSGNWNSGDWNNGNWNSGNMNNGNWNSGNRNNGNWNSGNWNSGNWNSGDWNSGNRNSGYFNIDEPKVRIFGKETDIARDEISFPDFLCFGLTEWVYEYDMTEEQKQEEENQYYKTTGGILVTYNYKEAFQRSYNSLSKEQKEIQTKKLKELPNFDKDIFFQISGIMIDEEKEATKEEI